MSRNHALLEVLTLVSREGPISRREIGSALSLPAATVTPLVNELIRRDLVEEAGQKESTGGRRAALLHLKEASHILVGVKIAFGMVQTVLMDLRANVIDQDSFSVAQSLSPVQVAEKTSTSIENTLRKNRIGRNKVRGVGVGVSGLVDPGGGIVHTSPAFPRWEEVSLAELLHHNLRFPVFLDNDVAMATLSELWFGAGRGRKNFLYVHLLPGIRMGIVIEGDLYRGSTGNAGELGHVTYDEKGPVCYCGSAGCLECYVSLHGLLRDARDAVAPHGGSLIGELCGGKLDQLEPEQIYRAAKEGDRLAISLLRRVCHPLGLTMAGLIDLFDSELIIIGGSLAQAGDVIREHLSGEIGLHTMRAHMQEVELKLESFGGRSTAIGAGALVLQNICEGQISV